MCTVGPSNWVRSNVKPRSQSHISFHSVMIVKLVYISGIKTITWLLFCLNSNFCCWHWCVKPPLWYGSVTEPSDTLRTYTITANMLSLDCAKKKKMWFLVTSIWFVWIILRHWLDSAEKQLAAVDMCGTNQVFLGDVGALYEQWQHGRLNRWLWHFTSSWGHWQDSHITISWLMCCQMSCWLY